MKISYSRAIELLEKQKLLSKEFSNELNEALDMAINALRHERLNGIGGLPIPTDEVLEQWRELRKQGK